VEIPPSILKELRVGGYNLGKCYNIKQFTPFNGHIYKANKALSQHLCHHCKV